MAITILGSSGFGQPRRSWQQVCRITLLAGGAISITPIGGPIAPASAMSILPGIEIESATASVSGGNSKAIEPGWMDIILNGIPSDSNNFDIHRAEKRIGADATSLAAQPARIQEFWSGIKGSITEGQYRFLIKNMAMLPDTMPAAYGIPYTSVMDLYLTASMMTSGKPIGCLELILLSRWENFRRHCQDMDFHIPPPA
jgi:hypothetical protein